MAQASSVPAREPSMEEILASIRRIIEDSDSGDRPDQQRQHSDVEAQHIEAEPDNSEAPAAETAQEVEAFRSELSAMEHEAELQQEPVAPAEPHYDAAPVFEPAQPAPPEPGEQPVAAQYVPPEVEPEFQPPIAEHIDAPDPVETELETREPQSLTRSSILSEGAERQVTAAFEELSGVFASTQKRSFDDVAEELMRPMLQDWLDNNLPLLVERLVREEIERVARGGSR